MRSRTSASAAPSIDDDLRAVPKPSLLNRVVSSGGLLVFVIDLVLFVYFSVVSTHHVFFSQENVHAMLVNVAELLLLALAVTILLSASILDLSQGANLVLSSVVAGKVIQAMLGTSQSPHQHVFWPCFLAFLAALGTGVAFGLVNGFVVTVLRVNSVIATLGTLGVGTGLALIITSGADIGSMPVSLQTFSLKHVGVFPLTALVGLVLGAIIWAVLRYTQYGLTTLAIGSSESASNRAGLKINRHLMSLFGVSGVMSGLAGFIDLARYGGTSVSGHNLDGLNALTAVIIGGTALAGGRANVIGTIWGALLSIILLSGLVIVGVQSYYQQIVTGAVLILAVTLDQLRQRSRPT